MSGGVPGHGQPLDVLLCNRRERPSAGCLTGFRFPSAMPSPHEPDPGELSRLLASLVAFLDEHRYCSHLMCRVSTFSAPASTLLAHGCRPYFSMR